MKFVVIADTHGQHEKLILPAGDVILHAGDISNIGRKIEVIDFLNWFCNLPFTYKIFVAGNHDFFFENSSAEEIKKMIPENVIYLYDSGITINNIKIWGSPITPNFCNWAFNRGDDIGRHWDLIPSDTTVLITHGPPYGTLDKTTNGDKVGCKLLSQRVKNLKPQFHVFGHIHEGRGLTKKGGTTFINASVLNQHYQLINKPVTFELEQTCSRETKAVEEDKTNDIKYLKL